MLRKLLGVFVKVDRNPCSDWPPVEITTPPLNTGAQQVGYIRMGAPIDMARPLGAPDSIQTLEGNAINLVYAKAGFQLEFSGDALSSVAYFVAEDQFQPDASSLRYSEPVIDSHTLTGSHGFSGIEELFGSPLSIDRDTDETILYYRMNDLTVEFELGTRGMLKRVNVYPAEKD